MNPGLALVALVRPGHQGRVVRIVAEGQLAKGAVLGFAPAACLTSAAHGGAKALEGVLLEPGY